MSRLRHLTLIIATLLLCCACAGPAPVVRNTDDEPAAPIDIWSWPITTKHTRDCKHVAALFVEDTIKIDEDVIIPDDINTYQRWLRFKKLREKESGYNNEHVPDRPELIYSKR